MPPTALTLTPPDAGWMDRVICRPYWALMDGETPRDVTDAKEVCRTCPVEEECRAYVLSLPPREDVYGVAGGMTAKERDLARRRVRRGAPAGSEEPRACTRGKDCVRGEGPQPADEFYRRPKHASGRETQCRSCWQLRSRERKAAKRAAEQTTDVKGIAS
jgi:hypothetical protein